MADIVYNPSTDFSDKLKRNVDKQKAREEYRKTIAKIDEMRKEDLDKREKELERREKKVEPKVEVYRPRKLSQEEIEYQAYHPTAYKITQGTKKVERFVKGIVPFIKGQYQPVKNKIKSAKLRRLKQDIERVKLQNYLAKLKMKQKMSRFGFPLPITKPVFIPPQIPPMNPMTMGDINSSWNSDIGDADGDYWGNEQYSTENFYSEDYLGNENFFTGLEINNLGKRTASPLLY